MYKAGCGRGTQSIGEAANIRRDITVQLTVIARQLRNRFNQGLEGIDVTRSQWSVIAVVARRPGVTQRVIAEVLEISEAAAGRQIDRLCAEGLLERKPKEDDRRAYCIVLTDAAKPMLERIGALATAQERQVFAGMSDPDIKKLRSLLDVVYGNINP